MKVAPGPSFADTLTEPTRVGHFWIWPSGYRCPVVAGGSGGQGQGGNAGGDANADPAGGGPAGGGPPGGAPASGGGAGSGGDSGA
ncbi:MAG: hypothetical protein LC798_17120, partial [Chloroflexi bacterium]|nr:hypothetical protein [Chloroflexota bacterium]